jgi:hypothetical protein
VWWCKTGDTITSWEADVTTQPDFGGLEIEEGLQEDLGAPPKQEHEAAGHPDDESGDWSDNEAHAAGSVCEVCGTVITPGQDVRRRADGRWMHEVCPVLR